MFVFCRVQTLQASNFTLPNVVVIRGQGDSRLQRGFEFASCYLRPFKMDNPRPHFHLNSVFSNSSTIIKQMTIFCYLNAEFLTPC